MLDPPLFSRLQEVQCAYFCVCVDWDNFVGCGATSQNRTTDCFRIEEEKKGSLVQHVWMNEGL